jgi:DNA replication and repair protein RecF
VNGSGKSNLLEAIFLLSTGKSFRTSSLPDLIQHEKETFSVKALFYKEGIDHSMTFTLSPPGKKIFYNDTSYTSFNPLLGIIPSVFLSPEDISILMGGPSERRRFLDLHLASIDPLYLHHLGRYQRALKQRNLLLKTQQKGLSIWEELMAVSASYIIDKRCDLIKKLQEHSHPFLLHLSKDAEPLTIQYMHTLPLCRKEYEKKWEEMRPKEHLLKMTLVGPHRDDISFSTQEKELKNYASEGQKRCALAALRLAEWQIIKQKSSINPIFGVDDFGVHLDKTRSSLLWDLLQDMGQVFLTAPSFEQATHKARAGAIYCQFKS